MSRKIAAKKLVFPAWAGMNRSLSFPGPGGKRVPRVGGDEPRCGCIRRNYVGVFPAWAGMNRP